MKAGKVWGVTELLEANGVLEFHRIEAIKGGVCSKHKHKYKWGQHLANSVFDHAALIASKTQLALALCCVSGYYDDRLLQLLLRADPIL